MVDTPTGPSFAIAILQVRDGTTVFWHVWRDHFFYECVKQTKQNTTSTNKTKTTINQKLEKEEEEDAQIQDSSVG